jgi:hypothetical protein
MDIIAKIVTLLQTEWIPGNTGDSTPLIANINEYKRISGDTIMLYNISDVPKDNSSGASSKEETEVVALDCRSFKNYAQMILIRDEIKRISRANQVDPFSDQTYDIQDITDIQDKSGTTVGLFRFKILIKFERFNITF